MRELMDHQWDVADHVFDVVGMPNDQIRWLAVEVNVDDTIGLLVATHIVGVKKLKILR